jgi:hypothetical protein
MFARSRTEPAGCKVSSTSVNVLPPVVRQPSSRAATGSSSIDHFTKNSTRDSSIRRVSRDDDDDDDFSFSHQTTVEILSHVLNRRRQTSDVIVRTTTKSRPVAADGSLTYYHDDGPRRTVSVLPVWKPVTSGGLHKKSAGANQSRALGVIPPIRRHLAPSDVVDHVTPSGRLNSAAKTTKPSTHAGAQHGTDRSINSTIAVPSMWPAPSAAGNCVMTDIVEDVSDEDDEERDIAGMRSNTSSMSPVTAVSITMSSRATASSSVADWYGSLQAPQPPSNSPADRDSVTCASLGRRSTTASRSRPRGMPTTDDCTHDVRQSKRFSVAEWNRQKVLHLRRASLRRACLIGPQSNWMKSVAMKTKSNGDSPKNETRRTRANRKREPWPAARGFNAVSAQPPAEKMTAKNTTATESSWSSASNDVRRCCHRADEVEKRTDERRLVQRSEETFRNGRIESQMFVSKIRHQDGRKQNRQQPECSIKKPEYSGDYSFSQCQRLSPHSGDRSCQPHPPSSPTSHHHNHLQQQDAYDSGLDSDAKTADYINQSQAPDVVLAGLEKVTSALQLQHQHQQRQQQCGLTAVDEAAGGSHQSERSEESRDQSVNGNEGGADNDKNAAEEEHSARRCMKTELATIMSTSYDARQSEGTTGGHTRLTRKASLAEDRRGSFCRYELKNSSRRTTLTDSKSSTPALLEPQDYMTDFSRPVSSLSSSIPVDEITSLPGSPFYRQVLQRRSSSIDSSVMSRPGSDFLDVPILLVQPRDRSPSFVDLTETSSAAESPTELSPVCQLIEDTHGGPDLQQQVSRSSSTCLFVCDTLSMTMWANTSKRTAAGFPCDSAYAPDVRSDRDASITRAL